MDTTDPPPLPQTSDPYVARTPGDVLAAIPVVLGFEPEDSMVMLTFGSRRPFNARVDLAQDEDQLPVMVRTLVEPAVHHGVERVVLVAYADDGPWAGVVLRSLAATFATHGIEVTLCLRAHAARWWPILPRLTADERGPGTPYDAGAHEFRARSVLDGRVTLPDRAAVAARVAPDRGPGEAAVLAALEAVAVPSEDEMDAVVVGLLDTGRRPDDHEVATLLQGVADGRCRDRVYRRLLKGSAAAHVSLWSEVVRRSPDEWAADPAGVLALAAWVSGDGALAWCAVERAETVRPGHRLAGLVAGLLERAVPPEEWEEVRRPLAG